MAGPGGGPPRKSHTKSRKGCKTCKRRHIRCDENFPQCRNCTKHSCRCDYQDQAAAADEGSKSPRGPNLLWSPSIEAEIDNWIRTGTFPFQEINIPNHQQFRALSKIDLRLVHHVLSIYRELHRKGLALCTAWLEQLPLFLDIALKYDFVMSALLTFSAAHLASQTKDVETNNLLYHLRGIALNGLNQALNKFGQELFDPVLAASILLSWQVNDWVGWQSVMNGITSVMSMVETESWRRESVLAPFVENYVSPPDQPAIGSMLIPGTMGGSNLSGSPLGGSPLGNAALGGVPPLLPEDDLSVQEAISALQIMHMYVQHDNELYGFVEDLLKSARELEVCMRTMRSEQLFEQLQSLRMRIMWAPVRLVQLIDQTNLNLVVVAHLYSLAMAVDITLPELMGAAFGALTTAPMVHLDRRLRFSSPGFQADSPVNELMRWPRQIADKTRMGRRKDFQQAGPRDANIQGQQAQFLPGQQSPFMSAQPGQFSPGHQSPYGMQNLHLDSGPTTPNFPPTVPIFASNLSAEDLSVPPSPFLNSFVPGASRRHSGLIESHSPRPSSVSYDRCSFSGYSNIGGQGGDSPAFSPVPYSPATYSPAAHSPANYSPANYSPVPSQYLEDDHTSLFGENDPSWGNPTGNFLYDDSPDKGKGVNMG